MSGLIIIIILDRNIILILYINGQAVKRIIIQILGHMRAIERFPGEGGRIDARIGMGRAQHENFHRRSVFREPLTLVLVIGLSRPETHLAEDDENKRRGEEDKRLYQKLFQLRIGNK